MRARLEPASLGNTTAVLALVCPDREVVIGVARRAQQATLCVVDAAQRRHGKHHAARWKQQRKNRCKLSAQKVCF